MKTVKFFSAFSLIAILCVSMTYANVLPLDDIIIGNTTESVSVNWKNLGKQTVHVKIINENQVVVMDEKVKNQVEFLKQYRVTTLPSGRYNLVITKEKSRITQPFSVQNGELSVLETDKKVKHFPTFSQKNGSLSINFFLGYFGTITVKVLDDYGNTVYSQKNENAFCLHKSYNFDRAERGTYKVELVADGEVFSYLMSK
jgi:hypothetical protein